MSADGFPKTAQEIVSTLTAVFKHQKYVEIVQLLEAARAVFEQTNYDNWNGGTYTWALRLEVPVVLYASIEPRLKEVENEILKKMAYLERLYPNDPVGEVTLSPLDTTDSIQGEQLTPSSNEIERIWSGGKFRLFLSHLAVHKVEVSKLKIHLKNLGVDAFVAHEDIEPSKEWINEIELALRSMHALAALLTEKFHESLYTDQEIGWALGRGVPVIPVKMGMTPYGLAGKYQGVTGSLSSPEILSSSLVKTLLTNRKTCFEMKRSLIETFFNAESFAHAKRLRDSIRDISDYTDQDKALLWQACEENSQVKHSFGVPDSIYGIIGRPPKIKQLSGDDDVPF
jgi:hypothetical protein